MTGGIEQPNKEKVRTLGEKEAYTFLELMEADTLKQAERKENLNKNTWRERKNYSKLAEYSLK